MADYPLIRNPEELEALADDLRHERQIAVDTEADSLFHYFDKLCLLQISAGCGTFLIDPLALPEGGLAPLEPILSSSRIRKIFHAADYDLYVLQRYGGIKLRNVFDTMVSAQFLGYPAVGLAALVERHFGVQLAKEHQRTDWSRRPLKPAQVDYAGSDVLYLIELSQRLEQELRDKKRLSWAREEFVSLEERVWPEREFNRTGYLRIKGVSKLTPRGLAVLRELFLMRDKRARALDRPAFRVLGNGTLLDLAQRPPKSGRALTGRKGITNLVVRRLGTPILEAVARGLEGPEHPPPEKKAKGTGRKRLDRGGELRREVLKRWRGTRAGELKLDPGVFCPNAVLEEIAAADPKEPADLEGLKLKRWWIRAFGREVFRTLKANEKPEAEPAKSGAPKAGPTNGRPRRSRGRRRSRS
ncbi:MAG: HRDC domain-containing protein [Myxococcales bacterium]|nr:HRDC domain-containing protein [Myxococcales bacterium]